MKYDDPADYPSPQQFAADHGLTGIEFPRLDTAKVAKHSLAVLACWAAAIFGVDKAADRNRLVKAAEPDLWEVLLEVVEDQRDDIEDYIEEFDDAEAEAFANLLKAADSRPAP